MLNVGDWLQGLGLGQYAGVPRQRHRCRPACRLTADDLKDIGVASLGHRKKLLEAIAALPRHRAASPTPHGSPARPSGGSSR